MTSVTTVLTPSEKFCRIAGTQVSSLKNDGIGLTNGRIISYVDAVTKRGISGALVAIDRQVTKLGFSII